MGNMTVLSSWMDPGNPGKVPRVETQLILKRFNCSELNGNLAEDAFRVSGSKE